ncbi:MAG: hypothetical protein ACK4QP_16920 [Pseudorhizobium sp.]
MKLIKHHLMISACLVLVMGPVHAQDLGVSLGGVSVGVGTSDGIGVSASVGGSDGVNADASIGGSGGLADVDASIGGSGGLADVDASVGGATGINAEANVNTSNGIDAGVTASIGGSGGINADAGLGIGGTPGAPGTGGPGATGPGSGGYSPGLTPAQQQAFESMSDSERRRLLNRCGDLLSGGADAELAALCRMLRMTAQR